MIATDEQVDEFLEHFGVAGMRWGVRGGRSQTGISRKRGALVDRNARLIKIVGQARSGEKYKASAAIGKAFFGEKRQQKNWDKLTKNLTEQNDRLKAGNLLVRDKLSIWGNVSLASMAFQRLPNKPKTP